MVYWSDDQFRNICVKIFVGLATAPSVWSVQVWELKWTWHNKISSHRLLGLELATNIFEDFTITEKNCPKQMD